MQEALRFSEFAIAGLFYYVGVILSLLRSKGIYKKDYVPNIFVGGNGSRIFSRITNGSYDDSSPFIETLKEMIIKSSGLGENSHFKIILSENPKSEVALGMIENQSLQDKELFYNINYSHKDIGVVAGESFNVSGKNYDKLCDISANRISNGINIEDLNELANFIKIFNNNLQVGLNSFKITEDMGYKIKKLVNDYYMSKKGKDTKKIFVEPIFIVELKIVLDMFLKNKNILYSKT